MSVEDFRMLIYRNAWKGRSQVNVYLGYFGPGSYFNHKQLLKWINLRQLEYESEKHRVQTLKVVCMINLSASVQVVDL